MIQLPTKLWNLPLYRDSVERVLSADSLRAVASTTDDPLVLLGLCFLARAGDPVRKEIGDMAASAKPEYAPIIAVLRVTRDAITDEFVSEVIRRDPDNALGHYLHGGLLHVSDHANQALEAFRRAAHCSGFRLYEAELGDALFKALDRLELKGMDRLCAVSWAVSSWFEFGTVGIQSVKFALEEIARHADRTTRSELADILLVLAGHLFASVFENRWYAYRAAEAALQLKADLAATENIPLMNGYAAAVHSSLLGVMCGGIDPEEAQKTRSLDVIRFLPARIYLSFSPEPQLFPNLNPPEDDRPTFDAAKLRVTRAARKLIDLTVSDPDRIFKAFLQGVGGATPEERTSPCNCYYSAAEDLMQKRPDLFQAGAELNGRGGPCGMPDRMTQLKRIWAE